MAREVERYEEDEEDEESDADDFIVDDDGNPLEKKKRSRRIFNDAHLQEGQDIFGVDFDYDEFEKYEENDYEDESEGEDEYEEEGYEGERERRPKKASKKRTTKKSIFEIYEPSELKRGHFTDLDNEVSYLLLSISIPRAKRDGKQTRFGELIFPSECNCATCRSRRSQRTRTNSKKKRSGSTSRRS